MMMVSGTGGSVSGSASKALIQRKKEVSCCRELGCSSEVLILGFDQSISWMFMDVHGFFSNCHVIASDDLAKTMKCQQWAHKP